MSSAFDIVDDKLLLERLCKCFGFRGQVLKWFESYLQDRKQFVVSDDIKSDVKDLYFGFLQGFACVQTSPISFCCTRATKEIGDVCTQAIQGSVLGPILYSLYIFPLDARREFHLYADDAQLYFAFRPTAVK